MVSKYRDPKLDTYRRITQKYIKKYTFSEREFHKEHVGNVKFWQNSQFLKMLFLGGWVVRKWQKKKPAFLV